MSPLTATIAAEIRANGPVSFARFMALALYHPEHGYYEQHAGRVGRRGDFYTSVSVGPLLGELLAGTFAAWARTGSLGDPWQLVEAGAHDGRLAADILGALDHLAPGLAESLTYLLVEPSPRRRAWQEATLRPWPARVRWVTDWSEVPERSLHGVILSNELLDALPVHRYVWDALTPGWREWCVDSGSGKFHWVRGPVANPARLPAWITELPESLLQVLPDGFTVEDCPAATAWWSQAARRLARGRLLTLDYGLTTAERLDPGRSGGTLRSIRAHRITDTPLADPGGQDLTAQVDFSQLEQAGIAAGLQTEALTTQGRFLGEAATRLLQPGSIGLEWTEGRKRQLQTLMHPQHLGASFRVLVQRTTA